MIYRVILVSGSVDILVERIAGRINADSWLSCAKAVFEENTFIDLVSMADEITSKQ